MAEAGLFGPSPWEVQQAQQQALGQSAAAYAQMSPIERAAAGMYQAGGMLTGVAADALGGVNVPKQQAQRTEQIMGAEGTDLTSSQGLFAKADEFRKAGDLRTAAALTMKAQEMKRQEQAAALAARKQDFQENDAMEFKRLQLTQAAELKQAQLAQAAEAARMRSEDTRLGIEARREAAREANQMKLMLAQMTAEIAKMKAGLGGVEKPMTAAQKFKEQQASTKSMQGVRQLDDTVANTQALIDQIEKHPGLGGATGMRGAIFSMPGGEAKDAENLIKEFKAQTAMAGLNLVRQGGGIGAMTEKEWPLVEQMVAAIDPLAGKDAMLAQMRKVLAKIEQIRENARMSHTETFGGETAPAAPTKPGQRIKVDANGNIIK